MIRTPSVHTKENPDSFLRLSCRRLKIVRIILAAGIVAVIPINCASERSAPIFLSDTNEPQTSPKTKFSGYTTADSAQDEPDTNNSSLSVCFNRETVFDQTTSYRNSRFEDINRYSLDNAELSFGFAYQGTGCSEAINFLSIPSVGSIEPPLVIDPFQTDGCTSATDPIVQDTDNGWVTVWSENDDAGYRLFLHRHGIDNPSVPIEQTENYRKSVAVTLDQDDAVIAWISENNQSREIRARRLDQSSDTITIVSDPERRPEKIALQRLYDRFALVWLDMNEENKGLYLALLDEDLTQIGPMNRVTPYVDGHSTFDLSTNSYGHAILYSTALGANREIRLRRFSEFGEWVGKERYIVAKPDYAQDGSSDSYGTLGYIVAYRSSPDAMADNWTIRMAFVTQDGRRVGDTYLVASAAPNEGRVTVRTTADGTIAVAWVDATAYQKRLRVVRIRMGCDE